MEITLYTPSFYSSDVEFWEFRFVKNQKITRTTRKGNIVIGNLIFDKTPCQSGKHWARHVCVNRICRKHTPTTHRRPYIQITFPE